MVVHSGIGKKGIQGIAVDWIAGTNPLTHFFFQSKNNAPCYCFANFTPGVR